LKSRFDINAGKCKRIAGVGLSKSATIKKEDIFSPIETGAVTPRFSDSKCNQCLQCVEICPTKAIHHQKNMRLKIELDKCIGCRACADVCNTEAIMAGSLRTGSCSKKNLLISSREENQDLKQNNHSDKEKSSGLKAVSKLKGTIKLFARSISAREVDCGSCNACELEIAAISNPVYDAERFGIHIVASPRHADALLVTGPVTRQMELALRKTDAATPTPKLVIAVGTCACSGGLFAESPVTNNGVGSILKVDYYIPGCPPSPQSILKSIAGLRNI
jgi:Ni,Fe-hydrogenase III small subunit/formate hydrogenlyase subunit 6/NADH:ubiquinone oxidoreductase subunit I